MPFRDVGDATHFAGYATPTLDKVILRHEKGLAAGGLPHVTIGLPYFEYGCPPLEGGYPT